MNVTPLIDVVMCLIVFFLIVGKLAHDRAQGVRPPATLVGESAQAAQDVLVEIAPLKPGEQAQDAFAPARAARVLVGGRPVADEAALRDVLTARLGDGARDHAAPAVRVRADRSVPYGLVEPVIRACQDLNVTSVMLVTERAG